MNVHAVLLSPLFRGAITGVLGAAAADYHAFRSFHSWNDFAHYSWGLASWRWTQGAIMGVVGASAYGALLGA